MQPTSIKMDSSVCKKCTLDVLWQPHIMLWTDILQHPLYHFKIVQCLPHSNQF